MEPTATPSAGSTIQTVSDGDFDVDTNSTASAEDIRSSMRDADKAIGRKVAEDIDDEDEDVDPKEKVTKAASELGKRGGEASAEARKKAEREKAAAEKKEAAKTAESEGEGDEDDADPKRPLGKPRHDPIARMKQATHQAAEAKRELAAEKARNEDLMRRLEAHERKIAEHDQIARRVTHPEPAPEQEPKPEDFDTYAEYTRALARFEVRQEQAERSKIQREVDDAWHRTRSAAESMAQKVGTFMEKMKATPKEELVKIDPDITGLEPSYVAQAAGREPDVRNGIADAIVYNTENPAAVMFYLSEHPDEFERLIGCPDQKSIDFLMKRIEARAGNAVPASSRPAPISQAHPPVRPVPSSAQDVGMTLEELAEGDDVDAYIVAHNKHFHRRRS